MRGLVAGLGTPHPLIDGLPALFQEDDFATRLLSAFDDALAPVVSSLDNLGAYLDPQLAPEDFLEWLSGWVGLALDESWPLLRRRALVADAVDLYSRRGTARGIADAVALFAGVTPEIEENGGTAWSTTPNTLVPGSASPYLLIQLPMSDLSAVDLPRLEAVVAGVKPAHVIAKIGLLKPIDANSSATDGD